MDFNIMYITKQIKFSGGDLILELFLNLRQSET